MPALLNRTSSRPRTLDRFGDQTVAKAGVGDVADHELGAPTCLENVRDHRAAALAIAARDDDPGAMGGELPGGSRADSGGRAGDENCLAGKRILGE